MTDNFDFKKFLAENKLGAYSKASKLNEGFDREGGNKELEMDLATSAAEELLAQGLTGEKVIMQIEDMYPQLDAEEVLKNAGGSIEVSSDYDPGPGEDENFGLGDKGDYEDRIYEALSAETIDAIEGLVPERDMALALEYLNAVKQELEGPNEEFDEQDIVDYLHMRISEYLGKPSSTMGV